MGRNGPQAEGTANDECVVDFANIPVGTYSLNVSPPNSTDTNTGSISMTSTGSTELEVKVKRNNEPERILGTPVNAFVSAADLGIPAKARKEFDKANELAGKQDLAQAIQRLNKAIAIYPAYASAYNNLGVIYSRLGDSVREREALQKAISINDHLASAYLNIGRMNITNGDFASAETVLNKAFAFDPNDAMALTLLTYSEFMEQRLDQALANSRKAHSLLGPHALVHLVAARALEQKSRGAEAIAELELFLKEDPSGRNSENARKELAALRAIVR